MSTEPAGRSEADLAAFWAGHQAALRAYAQRRLAELRIPTGHLQVEDVLQQTYAELRTAWAGVISPSGFAYSQAKAVIFAALRHEKRRGPAIGLTLVDDVTAGEPASSPEEQLVDEEEARRRAALAAQLPQALEQLTDRQRAAVEMCDLQGRTRQEAAEAMEVTIGTVNQHRDRAMNKLQDALHRRRLDRRASQRMSQSTAGSSGGPLLMVFAFLVAAVTGFLVYSAGADVITTVLSAGGAFVTAACTGAVLRRLLHR